MLACADAVHLPLLDQSVDLVVGSPPYSDRRTYGRDDASRDPATWVCWMVDVTVESLRVCRGPVCWVVQSTCADGNLSYNAEVERLMVAMLDRGDVYLLRPLAWIKNAFPSGRKWFTKAWEFVAVFANRPCDIYFNVSAIATRTRYRSGGNSNQRRSDGTRRPGTGYPLGEIRQTMPNVIEASVGGGHMGHPLAHENHAPYPESVPRYVIACLSPPDGLVLDPFVGSGTTVAAAAKLGRRGIGFDIETAVGGLDTARRRLADVLQA